MRTYDDTFSGEKIYPGKVRCPSVVPPLRLRCRIPARAAITAEDYEGKAIRAHG